VGGNESFTRIAQRGTAPAMPEDGHSVHVELDGMRPGAEHFYRFHADGDLGLIPQKGSQRFTGLSVY
jgi:phosphodiesterase/alkaline phosphatase D-like protein